MVGSEIYDCQWCGETAVPERGFAICSECGYAHVRHDDGTPMTPAEAAEAQGWA